MEELTAYKCKVCGELYTKKSNCLECEFKHAKEKLANALLEEGSTLWMINYTCGFGWELKEEHRDVTKDNCFIISHWQCCEKPAYRITRIDDRGNLTLNGKGSWSGYYGDVIRYNRLPKPYPKEDLFVDGR